MRIIQSALSRAHYQELIISIKSSLSKATHKTYTSIRENTMNRILRLTAFTLITLVMGCGGSGGGFSAPAVTPPAPPTPDPEPVTLSGLVLDGPVSGGTLFIFASDGVTAALQSASEAEDRSAALESAEPVSTITLEESEDGAYQLQLPASLSGSAVFILFDNSDAEDLTFGDTPFNLESVVVLGGAGSNQTVHITPQTSMLARQVRASLPLEVGAIEAEISNANDNIVTAFRQDQFGNVLLPAGTDLIGTDDGSTLLAAANHVGALIRSVSSGSGITRDDILEALALDALDGRIDGSIPASFSASSRQTAAASAANDFNSLGKAEGGITAGSCTVTASILKRACEVDVMDDFLEGVANCQNGREASLENCLNDARSDRIEVREECDEVYEARIEVCEKTDDRIHEPGFGEAFVDNFVDPRQIGISIAPNPWVPLVKGNQWVYAASGEDDEGEEVIESIVVTVTDRVKLIEGVPCVVVTDVVSEGDEAPNPVEDTDDWFAQDTAGNVWYCGEISLNFETFEDDEPVLPELVHVEGSWKSGRDGAKAGMLLPFSPTVGVTIRQEVLWGEAEDVIDILSLTGTESSVGASCNGNCLVTLDYTALEPGGLEHKYYAPGIGLIVETKPDSTERLELVSFTNTAAASLGQ